MKRFLTNQDNIEACPTGRDHYWNHVKKDANFPHPLPGMGGKKEFYNSDEMEEFWILLSKTGLPTVKEH